MILLGTALACVVPAGTATLGNPGAHGFSEILYAFTSGAGNNGSAFGGITVSGRFYAVAIAIAMFIGRYWLIVPVLAIAGSLARKKAVPATAGTLPTHGPLFVGAARRHGRVGRRAHLLPGAGARSDRRAPRSSSRADLEASCPLEPVRSSTRRSCAARALDSLRKLDPRHMVRNPVMFVVEVGSAFTTLLGVHALVTGHGELPAGFILAVAAWLWFTVLFANFAEAMAEGRGKAQADVAAARAPRRAGEAPARAASRRGHARSSRRPSCARTMSCWSRRATRSRPTAT